MKKRMKAFLLVSVLLTLTIALSACSGDKAGDTSQDESSITIGIPQDLEESLDPHKAVAAVEVQFHFGKTRAVNTDHTLPAADQRFRVLIVGIGGKGGIYDGGGKDKRSAQGFFHLGHSYGVRFGLTEIFLAHCGERAGVKSAVSRSSSPKVTRLY